MNWFPIPRYRVMTLYLVTLACGHSGMAGSLVMVAHSPWSLCPWCGGAAQQVKLTGLPVTWNTL